MEQSGSDSLGLPGPGHLQFLDPGSTAEHHDAFAQRPESIPSELVAE